MLKDDEKVSTLTPPNLDVTPAPLISQILLHVQQVGSSFPHSWPESFLHVPSDFNILCYLAFFQRICSFFAITHAQKTSSLLNLICHNQCWAFGEIIAFTHLVRVLQRLQQNRI